MDEQSVGQRQRTRYTIEIEMRMSHAAFPTHHTWGREYTVPGGLLAAFKIYTKNAMRTTGGPNGTFCCWFENVAWDLAKFTPLIKPARSCVMAI